MLIEFKYRKFSYYESQKKTKQEDNEVIEKFLQILTYFYKQTINLILNLYLH